MTIQDSTNTNGELSTAWGRGGPKVSPRAAPGGGQVAPVAGTDQHAGDMRAVLHGADAPSSPGLVGKQTSDTSAIQSISFTATTQYDATRELAQSARLRKLKLVVGHHADTVRSLFADSGVNCQCIMVTLTYAPGVEYSPRQITEYVKRMRGWLEARQIVYAYEWVLEMQMRGAPHYHVLWWVPSGLRLPKPDTAMGRQRKPLWPCGLTRIEKARSGPAYITKYASKGDQGRSLPKGARLFGVGGFDSAKRLAQWRALPAYIRNRTSEGDVVRKAAGGGWLVRSTGEHIESEWERRVQWGPGYCRVTLLRRTTFAPPSRHVS